MDKKRIFFLNAQDFTETRMRVEEFNRAWNLLDKYIIEASQKQSFVLVLNIFVQNSTRLWQFDGFLEKG